VPSTIGALFLALIKYVIEPFDERVLKMQNVSTWQTSGALMQGRTGETEKIAR